MAIPLKDLVSREVTELPEGVEKSLVFGAAVVTELATGREVQVAGPVDLSKFGSRPLTFTDRVTGEERTVQGITLIVVEEDGAAVRRNLNLVSKRLIEQLHGDLASGDYLKTRYRILALEPAPRTHYQVLREPLV